MTDILLSISLAVFGASVTLLLEHYQDWIYWLVTCCCLIFIGFIYPRMKNQLPKYLDYLDKRIKLGSAIRDRYFALDHSYWHILNYMVLFKTVGIDYLIIQNFNLLAQRDVINLTKEGLNDELLELVRLRKRIKKSHLLNNFDESIFKDHELHLRVNKTK